MATDPDGSRFLQRRIKTGSSEERHLAFDHLLPHLSMLWPDASANFVVQQLLEHGDDDIQAQLMERIETNEGIVALSLHMHGCRVIQKAIKCLKQNQVLNLITRFHDQVLTFIHDPNGNHVIQKCIQVVSAMAKEDEAEAEAEAGAPTSSASPVQDDNDDDNGNKVEKEEEEEENTTDTKTNTETSKSLSQKLQFIIDDVVANVESLSKHRYGCRVVQRAIEHCVDSQKNAVLAKIIECHERLIDDQYGNYVVQQSLVCGGVEHREEVVKTLVMDANNGDNGRVGGGSFVRLSKHKYASNVVEGVLKNGTDRHRGLIVEEMLKDDNQGRCCAIELSLDPIANYVVKSALECTTDGDQVERLMEALNAHRMELAKSPFAKYVVAKLNSKRDTHSIPEASRSMVYGQGNF